MTPAQSHARNFSFNASPPPRLSLVYPNPVASNTLITSLLHRYYIVTTCYYHWILSGFDGLLGALTTRGGGMQGEKPAEPLVSCPEAGSSAGDGGACGNHEGLFIW